jgi:single-strand DNA-binding protein
MIGLNRIFILGYLGGDPQTHPTKAGGRYTTLSIATHRKMAATGPREEKEFKSATDWHYVRVWGKQGESCARFLQKGHPVLVEGYLTQVPQQKEGKTERYTAINAIRVDFLPRSKNATDESLLTVTEDIEKMGDQSPIM